MRTTTRHLVLAGAALVGAATATTSAISLYGIAVKCGIPEPWAVANPIALDAGAAVSALAWITQDGERRRWAKWTAVAALAASLVENGLDHALSLAEKAAAPAPLQVPLWLVLGVSACIPAMLFAVVHLAALMVRAEAPVNTGAVTPARDEAPVKPPVERAPRKPTTKLRAVAGVVDLGKPTRTGRDLIRAYIRTHPEVCGGAEVIKGMAEQGIKVSKKEAYLVYGEMQRAGVTA